ncbi:hypothetical protein [Actinoplanes utahensis]|uniref:Uncharacterized protein n=1 Tax=Actinoplanes utahensis TaxID=1869 RepID=A0A0A6UKE0_ACTUT|nr:hypothetical protein [Actinoplanes utahensis]KHD75543.1 hypothetical protein MB27_22230 [Actinoplanes utahensis]GIF32340.1 hypothetical protein Aut01nite_53260 [Actinoplanes utahensis]
MPSINISDVMDFLVDRRAASLPPEGLAEILTSMAWSLDEQANVLPVARGWLGGDDEYRAAVALWIDDFFPADSRAGLVAVAEDMESRFPALAERAREWIRRWDAAHEAARSR